MDDVGDRLDYLVCYEESDRQWAEWIAWHLERAGYHLFFQPWDAIPGSNKVLKVDRAVARAEATLLVLSERALGSEFVRAQWSSRFLDRPGSGGRRLIPVRVEDCRPEGLLGPLAYVDLVGIEAGRAEEVLLAGVSGQRPVPEEAPAFPGKSPVAPRLPALLPAIWNLPRRRNPNFAGRTDLIRQLEAGLEAGAAAITQAIAGLGGVGKTQIATEYAYRFAGSYDAVWWIRSEEPATLVADLAALGGPAGITESEGRDEQAAASAAVRWLGRSGRWLLIFDNARERSDLEPYLPRGGAGHVLITSRNPDWRAVATPLKVPPMTEDEAVQLLTKRSGDSDHQAAARLAKLLGYLPLALEQAAAYVSETGITLAAYETLAATRLPEMLALGQADQYTQTVATTFSLSFAEVEKASPAAARLLQLCAFLAPDGIPLDLLHAGSELFPEMLAEATADPLALNRVLSLLRSYSLIERHDDLIDMHRLVQEVVRIDLGPARRTEEHARVLGILAAAFPKDSNDVSTWARCEQLLPHVLAAADIEPIPDGSRDEVSWLLDRAAIYLRGRAQLAQARQLSERALAIAEETSGPDHPTVGSRVNNLGLVLKDLGDLPAARSAFERALAIADKTYGNDHPTVATGVNNLGTVLQDLGDLPAARSAFERALGISEKIYGPGHPTVAIQVNNLGMVLKDLGDLPAARSAFERALATDEKTYGPDHPSVATLVNNLGLVFKDLGDLPAARTAFERALAIGEKAYGPDHPTIATVGNNLGTVLHDLGDLPGARSAYERALAIDERAYGPDHPTVARDVNNLGSVLHHLADLPAARSALERALAIDEKTYGPDHPTVATDVNNLGLVLKDLGDLSAARSALERALAIDEKIYGPDHPTVARDVNNLGSVLSHLGDLPAARTAFERALAIAERTLGPDHPSVVVIRQNLQTLPPTADPPPDDGDPSAAEDRGAN